MREAKDEQIPELERTALGVWNCGTRMKRGRKEYSRISRSIRLMAVLNFVRRTSADEGYVILENDDMLHEGRGLLPIKWIASKLQNRRESQV